MQRREFLAGTAGVVGAGLIGVRKSEAAVARRGKPPFKMNYAPHIGMFRHHGKTAVDQIKFMYDQGFRAMEDNGMRGRPVAEQEAIGAEMERLGMAMGVFVATADFRRVTFAGNDAGVREKILADIDDSVEVAKRVRAKWVTVVPGLYDQRVQWEFQTANAIENLKRAAERCEKSGLVMVIEALNPWHDHPGMFLSRIPQSYMLCRAVGSPCCKILFDIYHQQITEGNLIPNFERAWSEIGYVQIGDNPGRKEPTTGEINYKNIFRFLHHKGYEGILGMEHGNSKGGPEGELAVIRAYRECDDFD